MNRTFKSLFLCAFFICISFCAFGQKIKFETNAPLTVAVGERFPVEYVMENGVPDDFSSIPDFEGFDVLAGPTFSYRQAASISRNNIVQTSVNTYTFILLAKEEGRYTIPSVTVTVQGASYTSKAVPIEVTRESSQLPTRPQTQTQLPDNTRQETVADEDIFLRAIVNRTTVYKGQPVRVSFKLYKRVPISNVESPRSPLFNGFWIHELDASNQRWQRETYNNKVYETITINEYLLYPQQSGNLKIDPYQVSAIVQLVVQDRRPSRFDELFGGGPNIREVRKSIASPAVNITVLEFPGNAPEGFNGAVGNFTLEPVYPQSSISVNNSATFSLKISGSGNLPLIQFPKVGFPASFEQLNIKTTESYTPTGNGLTGYRQFEYPFIPRAEGEYEIEPAVFTYFDPEGVKYVTLSTDGMAIYIDPDSTGRSIAQGAIISGITKEDIKILGQDIRFIKIGNPVFMLKDRYLIRSIQYYVILIVIISLFVFLLFYMKSQIKQKNNLEALREKRANKVALSRLKAAESHLKSGNERRFYDEMLKALWGYLSDKLNIPSANLTKENVREELLKRNIPLEKINKYTDLISQCEYAQYSPDENSHMSSIFSEAVNIISKMESYIKK